MYWQLSAWTDPLGDGVQRLFGCGKDGSECYGVFAPAGKEFSLHRRLSRHAYPELPERWVAGRAADGFLPWWGEIEGQRIEDAMLMSRQGESRLALPADRDPLPLAEYAREMEPITLNGRSYLCLSLSEGVPAAAQHELSQSEQKQVQQPVAEHPQQPGPGFYIGPDLPARTEDGDTAPCGDAAVQTSSTSSTGQ